MAVFSMFHILESSRQDTHTQLPIVTEDLQLSLAPSVESYHSNQTVTHGGELVWSHDSV